MSIQSSVQTSSKLPDVGTTIFSVIGQLSAQHKAINLSQGAPNFPCDPQLVEQVSNAMREGHNQYAPLTGLPALKEALAQKVHTLYGQQYEQHSHSHTHYCHQGTQPSNSRPDYLLQQIIHV